MKNFTDITQAQQVERWENVLRVLKALTPHQRKQHWNMGRYLDKTECGTVGCAAGHCSMDPYFRRRGLTLIPQSYGDHAAYAQTTDGSYFTDKVNAFFGHDGSRYIFFDTQPRPVAQVIKEVRAHIKTLQAPRVEA